MTNKMAKFNKLCSITIKLIWFLLILHNVLAEEAMSDHNTVQKLNSTYNLGDLILNRSQRQEPALNRVKRKGFGSFFGGYTKETTPNEVLPSLYGRNGKIDFDSNKFHNERYREENIYYLVVAAISFGVTVYCCYQCQSETRSNLDDRFYYRRDLRRQQLQSNIDETSIQNQQSGDSNAYHKQMTDNSTIITPTAPSLQINEFNMLNRSTVDNLDYNHLSINYDNPPSYLEAIKFDSKQQHQTTSNNDSTQ